MHFPGIHLDVPFLTQSEDNYRKAFRDKERPRNLRLHSTGRVNIETTCDCNPPDEVTRLSVSWPVPHRVDRRELLNLLMGNTGQYLLFRVHQGSWTNDGQPSSGQELGHARHELGERILQLRRLAAVGASEFFAMFGGPETFLGQGRSVDDAEVAVAQVAKDFGFYVAECPRYILNCTVRRMSQHSEQIPAEVRAFFDDMDDDIPF